VNLNRRYWRRAFDWPAITGGGVGSQQSAAYRVSLKDPAFDVEKIGIFRLAFVPMLFLK
jgi:hypothetical protein